MQRLHRAGKAQGVVGQETGAGVDGKAKARAQRFLGCGDAIDQMVESGFGHQPLVRIGKWGVVLHLAIEKIRNIPDHRRMKG